MITKDVIQGSAKIEGSKPNADVHAWRLWRMRASRARPVLAEGFSGGLKLNVIPQA